jgi:hypothetical protein
MQRLSCALFILLGVISAVTTASAWDYEGHRIVNQLGLAALPADFPAFVREPANAERIAFLAGEPDRWRNVPDLIMKQSGGSWTDHFCDLEQLPDAGLDPAKVSSFRYDFIVAFAAGRAQHSDKFPAIDPAKNSDHTREWPGFAPWAIVEYYAKLKSAFSYLKVFEELGTPEEIANAKANAVYVMGIMGHYVGDCAQPLHTTVHHNGWVGPNPNGYTTWPGFHSWVDGGLIWKAGITKEGLLPRITPAQPITTSPQPDGRDPVFVAVMDYLIAQNRLVEPLYQLDKAGKLSDEFEKIDRTKPHPGPVDAEGRAFVEGQLLKGGQMLAAVWNTAWRNAVSDTYLRAQLVRRQIASAPSAAK